MYIDNVRRTDRVTADRIVNEAVGWGMPRRRATELVGDLLEGITSAAATARAETDELPDEVPAIVDSQLRQVQSSLTQSESVASPSKS